MPRGASTSQGDAFALGEAVDAQIIGHGRCQINVRPDFAHLPDAYLPGWLVMVNAEGRRFFDEMAPYSVTQPIFLSQPHPIYAICDEQAKRAGGVLGDVYMGSGNSLSNCLTMGSVAGRSAATNRPTR